MNIVRASVTRPVFATMATLIVVLLGAFALGRLRIDLLPEVELPTLTVQTTYEGASPEVMERLVTQVLEEVLSTVPGVEELSSSSSEGESSVRVTFAWGTNLDAATNEVRSRLEDELDELPDDVTRPQVRSFDVNSFPIVLLGIASRLDPVELTTLIEDEVRYRFAQLPGVAQVDVWGGYAREVRVELLPDRVRALGLPLNTVLSAIRDANLDLPAGQIESGQFEVTLRAPAEFRSLDELRATVVATRDGVPVTLGQVAEVKDTYERLSRLVRVNGRLGLRVAIRKQADANTVEVSGRVLDEIARVNRDFPQIEVFSVTNQGNFIERSIRNVADSVLWGGGLAVVVLLFFLRNLRSTLVIATSIPTSIVATFALVYFGGFTLNLMTLGGLALGVGMMVDSSIVVLENIFRHRDEDGLSPTDAAVRGASEVGPAVVASTLTTLVIFLPVVFVQGVSGVLFRELAYVIVFSLTCSLVVSLTLVPMLAARLLKHADAPARGVLGRLDRGADRALAALDNGYRDLLRWVVRRRLVTIGVAASAVAATLLLVPFIGTEFLPPSDEGEVRVSGEMEIGTRLDVMDRQTALIEAAVLDAVPEKVAWVTSVGGSGRDPAEAATGEVRLALTPSAERSRSNIEVAADLRAQLAGTIPGMTIRTRAPQGQFLLERILGGTDGLNVEVRGFDPATLDLITARVVEALADIPGITDLDSTTDPGTPQHELRIDRQKAADVGVTARDIAAAIETAVAGSRAGEFRAGGNAYRILVQLRDAQRLAIDEVLDLTLRTAGGQEVALRNLVTVEDGRGPTVIRRKDQQRIVTVSASVTGRDLGSVARDAEAALAALALPSGYDVVLAGNVEEQRKAASELNLSLVLALVLVYMVLACQYESLRDPLVVMMSVPLAIIGVVLTLFLTETTLNIQSYIGCIMLGGIVVNNAILLVDQAGQLRRRDGFDVASAISEAGRRRLRPILMTTLTTILGLAPLALGIGEGADAQAPLARAVIGGLTSSTLTTLLVVPAVYALTHPERRPVRQGQAAAAASASASDPAGRTLVEPMG